MTNTTSAETSRPFNGRTAAVILTVAAVLAAILFIEWGGSSETAALTETPVSPVNQVAVHSLPDSQSPPSEWLQASGSSTGNPAWAPAVRAPFDTLWVLHTGVEIFSPPAIVDDFIYMAGNDKSLRGLNRITGEQLWQRTVTCGLSGGVAADSSMVYFPGQDGYMYALNRTSGSEEWRAGLGYHIFTDAALFADTLILAGNSMGSVAALNRETGALVWSDSMEGLVIGPAVSDSTAVFSTESGKVAAWNPGGTLLWTRSFTSQPSAPSISNGHVYIGFSSGKILALSLRTGETLWETALEGVRGRTSVTRPAVVSDSLVVCGTCNSRVVCLEASSGELLWETEMENWVAVTPAVCDTIVYASCDDNRIHLLSLNTGLPVDTVETGSYSGTPPIVLDGVMYAGNSRGDLVALSGTIPVNSSATVSEINCPVE